MAMSTASQPGQINVTPMIDVLLVLIIIFMVIQPIASTGLGASIPQPSSNAGASPGRDVVIFVRRDGGLRFDQESISMDELPERLKALLRSSAVNTIFVGADRDVEFDNVARVIDLTRGAGLYRIGLLRR